MAEDVREFGYEWAREAADAIATRFATPIQVALILGSGLGGVADHVDAPTVVPYGEIPHFPRSTVIGHAGRLILGALGGVPIAVMQGRFHLYEGYGAPQVVFPVRVLRLLGAETLVVTAAAGGLAPTLTAGSLVALTDHIGLPTLAGENPLRGQNDERFGVRFPALTGSYDARLRQLAQKVAQEQGTPLGEGVYAMVSGPSFESPAELRFLRASGADVVGMSTVPEVIAARHMGMRVLACCTVTNAALADSATGALTNHEEVLAVANDVGASLAAIIEGVLRQMDAAPQ